jgi:hypothetical protein
MNNDVKRIILIGTIILLLLSLNVQAGAKAPSKYKYTTNRLLNKYLEKMTVRALKVNEVMCRHEGYGLELGDRITYEQAKNRCEWLIRYAVRYNYLYPDVSPETIILMAYGIVETETKFVNFKSLDEGKSFGYISMQWDTAQVVANLLGDDYNLDGKRHGTEPDEYNKYDRWTILSNKKKQAQYAIYQIYRAIKARRGNLGKSAISYNLGINASLSEFRWRNYYFMVKGRADHISGEGLQ